MLTLSVLHGLHIKLIEARFLGIVEIGYLRGLLSYNFDVILDGRPEFRWSSRRFACLVAKIEKIEAPSVGCLQVNTYTSKFAV